MRDTNPTSRPWAAVGICVLLVLIGLGGCATSNGPADPRDPLERYNRAVFKFNDTLDRAVLKPVAKSYRRVAPRAFNLAISNFFSNLGDISVAVNDFLQLKVADGVSDVGRLALNTTLGFGGLFDVASGFGLQKHEEDFGQTLGDWGVGAGPYLVLPVFGPSTVRDAPALIPELALNPVTYVGADPARFGLTGTDLVDTRADLLDLEETLGEVALDRYTAIRNAFLDRREFLMHDGRLPPDQGLIKQLESLDAKP